MALARVQYDAAGRLREAKLFAPSVSRSYYAAFAAVHAVLIRFGNANPSETRGTWAHKTLPITLMNDPTFTRRLGRQHKRQMLNAALRRLRTSREQADYQPGIAIEAVDAGHRLSDARSVLEFAEGITE